MSDLLMISSGADLDWQVACLLKWWRYDSARTTQFKCNMQCTPSMSCMLCCCRLTTGGRCAATTTPWLNMAMMLRAQPSALLMLRIPWEVLAGTCRQADLTFHASKAICVSCPQERWHLQPSREMATAVLKIDGMFNRQLHALQLCKGCKRVRLHSSRTASIQCLYQTTVS